MTECPRKFAGEYGAQALLAADLARRGCWPTLAGWLDQPDALIRAVLAVWDEESVYRAKHRMFALDF